jgi:hypothetical protein
MLVGGDVPRSAVELQPERPAKVANQTNPGDMI